MRNLKVSFTFLSLTLFSAGSAVSDVTLTFAMDGAHQVEHQRMAVKDGVVRMESAGQDGAHAVLVDTRAGTMMALDPSEKTYVQMDPAGAAQMRNQMDQRAQQMRAMMEQQLANMPPEQRAQVEAMLEQQMGTLTAEKPSRQPVQLRASGGVGEAGGVRCKRYSVFRGTSEEGELCIAEFQKLGMTTDDFETLQKAFDLMGRIGGELSDENFQLFSSQLERMQGLPVKARHLSGNGDTYVTELESVDHSRLKAKQFEIPSDYRRMQMPAM